MFRRLSGSPMSCDGCGRHAASAAVHFLRRTHKVSSFRVISEQFVARGWTFRFPVLRPAKPASREPDRRPIHRFALDRFQSRKRTGSGYGLAHHLFYIRVPLTARRALANPFGRVLSAVAAYINRLLFSHSCAFSSKMIAQRYNFSMQGLQTPIEFFYFCE